MSLLEALPATKHNTAIHIFLTAKETLQHLARVLIEEVCRIKVCDSEKE